jgi:hypothetical protein
MPASINTDFNLPRDTYATFDALTLKQHIKNRLNVGGVFTDQNFEGSNLSALIDIIAFSYHISLFYLNQTSSEALFDEASVYENINRITKLIGYKPTGFKTSVLSFDAIGGDALAPNIYTIKRFSYFNINGINYSFIKDVVFSKTDINEQQLETLSRNTLLYQGKFVEHPIQRALGQDFEIVSLVVKDTINNTNINIEHDSINIFVKPAGSNRYIEYNEIDSIFNADTSEFVFEKRLNENGFYEFKFGNSINGAKLNAGDQVYIYYLKSNGDAGIVSPGALNGQNINIYTTSQFEDISNNIYESDTLFLTPQIATDIAFTNINSSTSSAEKETVEQIRRNAPKVFYAQSRIVTPGDFDTYISKNFANIVSSAVLVNNDTYINNVIKYYYDLGLKRPNNDPRFLLNQVKFSTTNQMNHVHAYMVPRLKTVDENNNLFFLTQSQKAEIINSMRSQQMVNAEIIPHDPVYTGVALGLDEQGKQPTLEDIDLTFIVIERFLNDRISVDKIKELVANIFKTYFEARNVSLGFLVNINDLTTQILNITGVRSIKTRRLNTAGQNIREIPFINLYAFNAIYPEIDIFSSSSNIALPFFKFPFLWNKDIKDRIIIETVRS